jgi:hypothetical protein
MLNYALAEGESGGYYGNRAQYEKRHDQIVAFLQEAIERLDAKQKAKAIEKTK